MSDLWCSLISAIAPNPEAMPAVLQSTIHLLESELVKARAALQEVRPYAALPRIGDEVAVGAMAAYRQNLIGRAPDFYGARRLTLEELGLQPAMHQNTSDIVPEMMAQPASIPPRASLEETLTNSLILDHMAPYLSVPSLMALSMTSRHLRDLITKTPYIFRHLDLTRCKGAQLLASHDDDSSTEDEVYSAPLRHIFASLGRRSLLQDVRTLVLDGLSVPADLVAEIILTDRFNVNILSIRECAHLNEHKLMQVIQHAVRPTRPQGTPRVKGVYFFSPVNQPPCAVARHRYRDWWGSRVGCSRSPSQSSSTSSSDNEDEATATVTRPARQQQNEWYSSTGKVFKHALEEGWARTLQKAEGIIAFDAVLCRGPRHDVNRYTSVTEESAPSEGPLFEPAVATVALGPHGCHGCHSSPEGPAIWGQSPDMHFPLLSPIPLHNSRIATAKRPEMIPGKHPLLIASCADCLADRWCQRCNKWFCFNCLPNPQHVRANLSPHQTAVRQEDHNGPRTPDRERFERGVSKDCWECGPTCASCKRDCQHTCQSCRGDYCIEHNEGCSATMCDWCNTSARHRMRSVH